MSARAERWIRIGAWLALFGGLISLAIGIQRVVVRMGFDYDLLLWADDYFMTSMLKLAAGVPVYTAVSDANSTIYSPGGPYVHFLLLSPVGLETSLLANRIVNQFWLAAAIGLGASSVWALARASEKLPAARSARALFLGLSIAALALCAYANPVADSLHPTNLELCALSGAVLMLARWNALGHKRLAVLTVLLPAAALMAKQTAGVAVAVALSWAALRAPRASDAPAAKPGRARWVLVLLVALPWASLALTLLVLYLWTGGYFKTWGFDIVASHPFHFWKVSDLYAGYFLLFVPALLLALARGGIALRRRSAGDLEWLRASAMVVAYVPFSLAALFKAMGGPNNLAVVGFLIMLIALPDALGEIARPRHPRVALAALGLVAAQIGVLYPRRRVPSKADYDKAALICRYAATRMRCGEKVLLGRGSVCYERGGVEVPIDRMNSILEVAVAGRRDELGFYERVIDQRYDVMILGVGDLMWFGQHLWEIMQPRYKPFFMTQGEREGDFWFHGWQGYVSVPTVFWERIQDAGTHDVAATGCEPARSLRPSSESESRL